MNLTISIGRNVEDIPLTNTEWATFISNTLTIACNVSAASPEAQIVQSGVVDGYWDGAYEESFTVTIANNRRPSRRYKRQINAQISALCKVYQQYAIAATWYKPSLIN